MAIGVPFERGRPKTGGRIKGSRNKYSQKFDDDLREVYDERGVDALRVCAVENPIQFLQLFDKRNPAEFEMERGAITHISDEILNVLINEAERRVAERRAAIESFAVGAPQTIN
jgi:hypothetical protein